MGLPQSEQKPVLDRVEDAPTATALEDEEAAELAATPTALAFIHSREAQEVAVSAAGLQTIRDTLGYALAPAVMPAGFRLTVARVVDLPGRPMATVFYEKSEMRLALFYPAHFAPIADPGEERPYFSPPPDAVTRVVVGDDLAYLMRGEWDDYTVQLLAAYTAQWEYSGRLTLYFPFQAGSSATQWAMVSVNTHREPWMDVSGLITIAESVESVTLE